MKSDKTKSALEQREEIQNEILRLQKQLASENDEAALKEAKQKVRDHLQEIGKLRGLFAADKQDSLFTDDDVKKELIALGLGGKAGKRKSRKSATGEVKPKVSNEDIMAFIGTSKTRKEVIAHFGWYDTDYSKYVGSLITAGCIKAEKDKKAQGNPLTLTPTGKAIPATVDK